MKLKLRSTASSTLTPMPRPRPIYSGGLASSTALPADYFLSTDSSPSLVPGLNSSPTHSFLYRLHLPLIRGFFNGHLLFPSSVGSLLLIHSYRANEKEARHADNNANELHDEHNDDDGGNARDGRGGAVLMQGGE